jgi:LemA protein
MNTNLIAILIFVSFIALFAIILYNIIVRKRNEVDNAFGSIDVQLKKRYDLIPNLVNTVKQYVKHEKELLSEITQMRTRIIDKNLSPDEKVVLDNQISSSMGNIMVAVENYPDLKANENFINLQRTLNEAESQISAARRTYNAVITDYNNAIQSFPGNLIAGIMGLKHKQVFLIPEYERQNIDVKGIFN